MDQPFAVPQSRIAEVLVLASAHIMCRQQAFGPRDALQGLRTISQQNQPGDERTAQRQRGKHHQLALQALADTNN